MSGTMPRARCVRGAGTALQTSRLALKSAALAEVVRTAPVRERQCRLLLAERCSAGWAAGQPWEPMPGGASSRDAPLTPTAMATAPVAMTYFKADVVAAGDGASRRLVAKIIQAGSLGVGEAAGAAAAAPDGWTVREAVPAEVLTAELQRAFPAFAAGIPSIVSMLQNSWL